MDSKGDSGVRTMTANSRPKRIWKPVRERLSPNVRFVLAALDGHLYRVPLAVLPGERPGSYLIEDLGIGYVHSGREVFDLLTPPGPQPETKGLLVVGDHLAEQLVNLALLRLAS